MVCGLFVLGVLRVRCSVGLCSLLVMCWSVVWVVLLWVGVMKISFVIVFLLVSSEVVLNSLCLLVGILCVCFMCLVWCRVLVWGIL